MIGIGEHMSEQGLYDIYDIWHVPFWQRTQFYVAVIAVLSAILCFLLWRIIKKYRSKKRSLPPWDQALKDLENLKRDNKVSAAHGKECYSVITRVLKKYMHERYGFDDSVKTDVEFLSYLEEKGFSSDMVAQLREIFDGSVTIKFANMQAVQNQIDIDFERSLAFIKKTRPMPKEKESSQQVAKSH